MSGSLALDAASPSTAASPHSASSSPTLKPSAPSPPIYRSPPSSHAAVSHLATSSPHSQPAPSPALRLPLPPTSSTPTAHSRPPTLDLSPSGSPSLTPSTPNLPLKRISSLTSSSPASHSPPSSSSSSPSTHSTPAPLSFRLRLSSLEVSSPHAEPIVLGSPPPSTHSASVPSPHTVFTSRIPRLHLPDEDSSSPRRPLIPILNLSLASPSAPPARLKHGVAVTSLTPLDSPHPAPPSSSSSSLPQPPLGSSSHDRAKRLAYYSKQCTPITDFLYVGGRTIACDLPTLRGCGITHIVNLVGDLCDNAFPGEFEYVKYYLLDHAGEDIVCVLYRVIELVEKCRVDGGKVLIHCQQGVSRSCVLCIAYIMWSRQMDYDAAFQYVRARRGICRPNVGFMAQLIAWHRRMTAAYHPLSMYRLAPHCSRDHTVVAKWVDRVDVSGLDDRGVFILHSHSCIYIWVGANVGLGLMELLYPEALTLVQRLRRFEHATDQLVVLYQSDERLAHPEHHSATSTSVFQPDPIHPSTSLPSLSTSPSHALSSPQSPHSETPREPFFPTSFTPSQRFWALLGGGSPHNSYRNHAYDEDFAISMLSALPARPASVPLPTMISARSASSPEGLAGPRESVLRLGEKIAEEGEREEDGGDADDEKHQVLEQQMKAVMGASAASNASPPASQRGAASEFTRRRSYHKSIDAGSYLSSADDHHSAQHGEDEDEEDGMEGEGVRLPTAQSLTSSVHGGTGSSHAQPLGGGGEEDEDEEREMSAAKGVPTASLYSYPSFEHLDHFDSDDLTDGGVFVLLRLGDERSASQASDAASSSASDLAPPQLTLHIWVGSEVQLADGFDSVEGWAESIAIEFVQQFPVLKRDDLDKDNVKVVVERQGVETEDWWNAFQEG